MAGITDSPFRRIARRFGAGLLYTECISAEGLRRQGRGSFELCRFDPSERPIALQLFGSSVEALSEAASIAAEKFAPDIIDINCGCPVKKFVTKGCGGALMQYPELIGRIVEAVRSSSRLPVSIKLRSGYFPGEDTAPIAAGFARDAGVALIAIHGRFVRKAKGTAANWDSIRRVKEAVPDLPVIGNGDVFSAADAEWMIQQTGCDRVMIGRWAEGRPWIFEGMKNGELLSINSPEPSIPDKIALILEQLGMMVDFYGEKTAVLRMRKQLGWYSHGWPGGGRLRADLMKILSVEKVVEKLREYEVSLDPDYISGIKSIETGSRLVFEEEGEGCAIE